MEPLNCSGSKDLRFEASTLFVSQDPIGDITVQLDVFKENFIHFRVISIKISTFKDQRKSLGRSPRAQYPPHCLTQIMVITSRSCPKAYVFGIKSALHRFVRTDKYVNRVSAIGRYVGQTRSVSELPIPNPNVPKIANMRNA